MKPLTADSTREEVLAYVADHDRRTAEIRATIAAYSDDQIDWRGDPPERREGCYWSKDGNLRVHVALPRDEDPVIARQRVAGEEDQSVPGWDFGA